MKLTSLILTLAFVAGSALGQERTAINDRNAARMLLGKHKLSLQWISWDYFGTAIVTNRGGIYRLTGQQKGRGNRDLLTIDGRVLSIDKRQFVFEGTIVTRVSHINGGQPCKREGEFTFRITGNRKYWRLMEMDNPCDEATDYVDIFLR